MRAGLISIEQLENVELFAEQYEKVKTLYPDLNERRAVHEIIRRMINRVVSDLIETSQQNIKTANLESITQVREHPEPLICFSENMKTLNLELKQFLRKNLYTHYRVYRMTSKAKHIIQKLFNAFMDDIALLPPEHHQKAHEMERENGFNGRARAVADYIAGMTDRYAITEYNRLFDPTQLT